MNLITEFSYYVMILALNCVLSSDEEEEGALGVVVCANSLERNALSLTLDFGLGKLFFLPKYRRVHAHSLENVVRYLF
jgi:hypothetical protein